MLKLISHRGNINGKFEGFENNPNYIDTAIGQGFDVEVDIRFTKGNFYLGHDYAQYQIDEEWLEERKDKLWIHCKNHKALEVLDGTDYNYFWHHDDDVTITSHGYIWAHPKIEPLKNSIAVIPESNNWNVKDCLGVCSDNIIKWKHL